MCMFRDKSVRNARRTKKHMDAEIDKMVERIMNPKTEFEVMYKKVLESLYMGK